MIRTSRLLLHLLILLIIAACATPTTPTGGPQDEEGPRIVHMEPESGTTNFTGDQIELSFSEFVDRESMDQAITIEPDIGLSYSLDWGRKSVAIEFDRELPDLTTVIVKIGTDLEDVHNNKMSEPVTIAVSTGPEIDEGEILGRIVDARTGKGTSGDRVFLYRTPVDLSQKANYTAETDTSGRFHFSYLRQGNYKVFWVNDQNRSKIWEREREQAQPFEREIITLEKSGRDTLNTLYKAQSDTAKPALQGVGLFSTQRMRLRFSENIELTDSSSFVVNDTLGNRHGAAVPLYIVPEEQYVLFVHSEEELPAEQSFELVARNIRDGADNLNRKMSLFFDGSSQEDTTLQRIIKQRHPAGLFPDEPLEIVYAKIITEPAVTDSVNMVEGEDLVEGWEHLETDQNLLKIRPQQTWEQSVDYEARVWNPARLTRKSYPLTVWHPTDYGAIEFSIADTTDKQLYQLNLISQERGNLADTTFTGSIEIEQLPPLELRCIIYADLNDNGSWDPGQVEPYEPPEPYFIQNNIPVEEGFTGEVTVPFE